MIPSWIRMGASESGVTATCQGCRDTYLVMNMVRVQEFIEKMERFAVMHRECGEQEVVG